MWRIQPVNAVTFQPVMAELDAEVSWERVLNGTGQASFTVQTKAKNQHWEESWWRDLDTEWKTILVLEWVASDGTRTPVYAGWVANRTAWSPRSGVATWQTYDARVWLSSRYDQPAKDRNQSWFDFTLVITNSTPGGAASVMIRAGMGEFTGYKIVGGVNTGEVLYQRTRATDPRYCMPLTVTLDDSGEQKTRSYRARERHVEDMLSELQGLEGGPDVDFVPEWASDGSLRLHVRIQAPTLIRNTVKLSADLAPGAKSDLLDLSIVKDGMLTATSMTGVGAGQGSDMLSHTVFETDVRGVRTDIPQRERRYDAKQTEAAEQLRVDTRGALLRHRQAAKAWSFNVMCGDGYMVTDFVPGTRIVIDYPGDLLEPATTKAFIVTSVSGSKSQVLKLTVQEVD